MSTLSEMFPNPDDCYFTLFRDAVFEHDYDINYNFEKGQFKQRDKSAVIMQIAEMADLVYRDIMTVRNASYIRCRPYINYTSLWSVVARYSRDIYGFRRITAKLRNLDFTLVPHLQKEIEDIISKSADFGFLIASGSPYIHRQAAVLFYWFSVFKPFNLGFVQGTEPLPEDYIIAYFNEYFTYYLIGIALHSQSIGLTIHRNPAYFKEFLNELSHRHLSRSSLEFFLPSWMTQQTA